MSNTETVVHEVKVRHAPAFVPPQRWPQFKMYAVVPLELKTAPVGRSKVPVIVQAATGVVEHGTWELDCPAVPIKLGRSKVTESELSEKTRITVPSGLGTTV